MTTHFLNSRNPHLTTRERDILQLIAQGKTEREVAAILGISYWTVHNLGQSIRTRLGVPNQWAAVYKAFKAGYIS
jgi:DNA-binding CsgD family transcriptional regulator